MHIHSALYRAVACALLAATAPLTFAVETHVWEQAEQGDFARGTARKLSIRSDGHITLAPQTKELDSTNIPYLWAIAQDSKGALYYAGGAPTGASTKIMVLPPGGKSKVFAEIGGLEVHALAVDAQDRLYAASLPDAKVYRIDASGKPQLFFDPRCKYIWSMVFDRSGNLYLATGDSGLIYRVDPDGKGSKFFDTQETHARSMVLDDAGNLIVGTEPSGLVIRITPKGDSFVLYQTNKREVTALAARDGVIYAAAVGSKTSSPSVSGPPPVLPSTPAPVTPTGAPRSGAAPPSLPPSVGSISAAVTGGSDLFRIQKDGLAERVWTSASDLIYAIAFDAAGKPLVGTGNKGIIYRIDSDQLSTQLLNTPPTQVTAFLKGKNNLLYVATGNVGNVYSIGPGVEESGTLESEVHDASDFAYWGKVHLTSTLHGGTVGFETRSGNVSNPQNNWSPWTKTTVSKLGGSIQSPPARFLQYRLTLDCAQSGGSPEVTTVYIAYLPKNIAPRVGPVEIGPFNYRQPPSAPAAERSLVASGSPSTLSLPPVGQKRPGSTTALEVAGNASLQYSKGFVTVRWNATDPNSDPLVFRVEIRSKSDGVWRTLRDKLQDRFLAFDSTTFPDGEYVVRVSASDAPGNTPEQALSNSLESDPFTIDNTPPQIAEVKTTGAGTRRQISFTAQDALSWIDKAEYSVNGGDWVLLNPVNKVTDSQTLNYQIEVPEGQIVAIRVFDEDDNAVVKQIPISD
jgi:sugar lactone lactonase YvrE